MVSLFTMTTVSHKTLALGAESVATFQQNRSPAEEITADAHVEIPEMSIGSDEISSSIAGSSSSSAVAR